MMMQINTPVCQVRMQAISDTMSILSGKWKFHILGTLIEGSKLGFMDLLREVKGIGTKMLSKELQDLEMNQVGGQVNAFSLCQPSCHSHTLAMRLFCLFFFTQTL